VKVLVTGGAGYIGAHVVRALAAAGHAPVILDDLRRSQEDRAGGFPLERVAIENTPAVKRVFERHRPEGVVHLAGYISVAESVRDPEAYWQANLAGAASLLIAAARVPPRAFLFSSTAAVYGNADVSPIPEKAPLRPTSPYGASKLAFEKLLHDGARASGFRSAALRYFNACGAHPDWHVGEEHDPEEHLIPRVIAALLDGRPVEVNGNDYSTPDGTCVRDYVHVTDLAEAHVRVLEADGIPSGLSANCGSGQGHSVLQVIEAIGQALKIRPNVAVKPRRPGDPASLVADPTTLFSHVAWRPVHSDLREIVGSAVAWELWRRAHRAGR
jgi:UDP-glucose-4-epimerase GalE